MITHELILKKILLLTEGNSAVVAGFDQDVKINILYRAN